MSANHHRSRMMFQCSSPFTSSFPPRFWKDVLISIGYKYGKMAPTDKNRWEKKKRAAAADDHPDRIGPHHSFRRTLHEPIDIDLCSSFSFHRPHRKRKRERNTTIFENDELRWDGLRRETTKTKTITNLFSSPSRGLSPSTIYSKKIEKIWRRHSSRRSMVMIEPR